jgi:hypothetical protein
MTEALQRHTQRWRSGVLARYWGARSALKLETP